MVIANREQTRRTAKEVDQTAYRFSEQVIFWGRAWLALDAALKQAELERDVADSTNEGLRQAVETLHARAERAERERDEARRETSAALAEFKQARTERDGLEHQIFVLQNEVVQVERERDEALEKVLRSDDPVQA